MSKTTTGVEWPYDAPQDDPLTALRIPVTNAYPGWRYLVALDGEGERPNEAEVAALVSYIDYQRRHWFNETYQRKLMERPFDIDGGHNTTVFHKYGADDWGYRNCSWEMGPRFWPAYNRTEKLTLIQVIDHKHTYGESLYHHWADWKAEHPEVCS